MTPPRAARWITWLSILAIAVVSTTSGAFDVDDAGLWTTVNNVEGVSLSSAGGYVHLIPMATARLLRPLPLHVQAVAYRVVALVGVIVLYVLLRRWLESIQPRGAQPAALALSTVLSLHLLDPILYSNLSWANWTALLASTTYLVWTSVSRGVLGWGAMAAVGMGLLTTPLGMIALPLLLARAWRGDRVRAVVLAGLVAGGHGLQAAVNGEVWRLQVGDAPGLVAAGLVGGWGHNFSIAAASLVVLGVTVIAGWQTPQHGERVGWLAYVGVAGTVAFVVSPRLAEQGFEGRYVLVPGYCALVAVGLTVLGITSTAVRRRAVAVFVAAVLAVLAVTMNEDRRGPMVLWLLKYRFMAAADRFRETCREGETMVFEDEPSSAIVLCRRQPLEPGIYPIVDFTPAVGTYSAETPLERRPAIVVPPPLFGRRHADD